MRFRGLFMKVFLCFWLATAVMFGALNVTRWLAIASDSNPERNRGAFGEALNLYAESAVQVYDSEGPGAFEQFSNRSMKDAGTEIELFDANGKPLTLPTEQNVTAVAAEVKQSQQHVTHIT